MSLKIAFQTALAAAGILVATATAFAQSEKRVSPVMYQEGGWNLVPILRVGSSPQTLAILALADGSNVSGENIVAVLFLKDPEAGVWETMSWENATQEEAVKYVKEAFDLSDAEDVYWGLEDQERFDGAAVADAPQEYVKGVLASDPLVVLVELTPDRNLIVESLVLMGYKAADIPIEKLDGTTCSPGGALEGISFCIETAITASFDVQAFTAMTTYAIVGGDACMSNQGGGPDSKGGWRDRVRIPNSNMRTDGHVQDSSRTRRHPTYSHM